MAPGRANAERRGATSAWLVVGLANPGSEYAGTRHNVGGDAVRLLAERWAVRLRRERRLLAEIGTAPAGDGVVLLAVPTTYMNESGAAVAPLVRRASLASLDGLVIVHDELDLEPGRLRLKVDGGLAGHHGLESIARALGTAAFTRLRIGIGKPPRKEMGADYVLARLSGGRQRARDEDVARAADILEVLVTQGVDEAQRQVTAR
ncbi:MAG: aminoacyl-tRNA hydrolase [Acidimicrobiales bacterium]